MDPIVAVHSQLYDPNKSWNAKEQLVLDVQLKQFDPTGTPGLYFADVTINEKPYRLFVAVDYITS
jgi:hypothetical protein